MGVDTANMRLLGGLLENIRVDNRTTAKSLVLAAADEIDALRADAKFANNMLSSVARCLRVENDCDIEYEAGFIRKERDTLRDEVDLLTRQRDAARRGMGSAVMVAELARDGEIPSPLPFHKMQGHPDDLAELDAAEEAARDIDCPCCGGSGHVDDVREAVTVLHWYRYDGTPDTLPAGWEMVLIVRKGRTVREVEDGMLCAEAWRINGGCYIPEIGDMWSPRPTAPSFQPCDGQPPKLAVTSCPACFGSGVVDDGSHGGIADTTPCDECSGTGVVESAKGIEKCECQGGI